MEPAQMADDRKSNNGSSSDAVDAMADLVRMQADALTGLFGQMNAQTAESSTAGPPEMQWGAVAEKLQSMWQDYLSQQSNAGGAKPAHYTDPAKWIATAEQVVRQLPLSDPNTQHQLWEDGLNLFETVLGQYGIGPKAGDARPNEPELPRSDRRFADPKWREQPFFALVHQAYLMMSEKIVELAQQAEGIGPDDHEKLVFAARTLADSLSPANFPLTNPVAIDKAAATQGQSLVSGMEKMFADLQRGQLTQTDGDAFTVGENIAVTPGKVIHETPLYQLIQYSPTTEKVLKTPLVIFPPWINRFYILDLVPRKSFVRWAVDQGITVFMVSWKSADASMADVVWDDYIRSQVEAVDLVCKRLKVPSTHVIGYCVAGTTLAATLAMLARKGEAEKVKSATFFTAQVDFEEPGDLKHFIDSSQIEAIRRIATDGYVDGRYLAATFNLLRGKDLIWNYVERNYLQGEDYRAFDLLHWNSDVTNLPVKWHNEYLRDIYRDNRLVVPDSLKVCDVPVDLRLIETPCFIQAGRDDHIAPPQSVWKLTRYLSGPWTFMLAGSGHIAGVVNPPEVNKYQYWTNESQARSLNEFVEGATEHPGSWWPYWLEWLKGQDAKAVKVSGKRVPGGGKRDTVIEDAPGRYVKTR